MDFFKGLSALDFVSLGSQYIAGKTQAKVAQTNSEAKARENEQLARIEAAKAATQAQLVAKESARKAANAAEIWKLASWLTAATAIGMVLLALGKSRKGGK